MKILAIDTSSKVFSLAVCRDEKILRSRNIALKHVLSVSIIPAIEDLLKKAALTLKDIDGFAVGLGPGSFTSLRVGVSTIKGLSFATGKPIIGISSLDNLACNIIGEDVSQICTLNDAKRNMVYACLYKKKNGRIIRKSDYQLLGIEALLKQCDTETSFIGDGVPLFKDEIIKDSKKKKVKFTFAKESLMYPNAKNCVRLAYPQLKAKKTHNVNRLVPLYLYPSDCQVRNN